LLHKGKPLFFLNVYKKTRNKKQIEKMINRQRFYIRKDRQSVTFNQVYAVICRYPDMFVKAEGRIMSMI
jgi:hypothetical protein